VIFVDVKTSYLIIYSKMIFILYFFFFCMSYAMLSTWGILFQEFKYLLITYPEFLNARGTNGHYEKLYYVPVYQIFTFCVTKSKAQTGGDPVLWGPCSMSIVCTTPVSKTHNTSCASKYRSTAFCTSSDLSCSRTERLG